MKKKTIYVPSTSKIAHRPIKFQGTVRWGDRLIVFPHPCQDGQEYVVIAFKRGKRHD